jgi:hypothetical protein
MREVEDQLDSIVWGDIAKHRVGEFPHGRKRAHEHVGVSDFPRQKVMQNFFCLLVGAGLD